MKTADVCVGDVVKNITVKIRITGIISLRVRMWLGVRIMRFGAWVIGCQSDIGVS